MKGYESYKTTNDIWINKIPCNWEFSNMKYYVDIIGGYAFKSEDYSENEGYPIIRIGDVSSFVDIFNAKRANPNNISELDRFIIKKGDLLIAMTGATIGKNCMYESNEIAYLNQRVGLLRASDKVNQNYLKYIIDASFFREFINLQCSGSAQDNIGTGEISQFNLPIPSLEEQTTIAAFLDYKTSLIDATIEKKKRLMELLKEKRQAVINEAVTKGLNANAPMKDSGVEWLGDIPEHWKIRNFDSTATKNQYSFTGGPFGSDLKSEEYTDGGVRIIQLQNIGVGVFKDDYKIYTSEEKAVQLASCLIFPGDIIIAKMADPVARATIIPNTEKKYIMASDGIRLEVDNDFFNTKFVEYSVNSIYFNSQAEAVSTGTTRLRIGLTVLKKLKILAPPIEEQNLIAEKLMIEELKINSIMSKLDIQIQKLQTYRQSLILEAVTGKIDVRDWEPTIK
jgi:type I restriction enzyme S subunit